MDQILNEVVTSGAVNPILLPYPFAQSKFASEEDAEPQITIKPEGANNIELISTRPIIDSSGNLSVEVKSHKWFYERPIEVFGEEFVISEEGGETSIFHRAWPLSGQGVNVEEAIHDLEENIRDLKDHYAHTSIDRLDGRAILFRDFVLNTINI